MDELNYKLADTGLTVELIEREEGGRDSFAVYVLEHRVPGKAGIEELGFCKQYGIEVD